MAKEGKAKKNPTTVGARHDVKKESSCIMHTASLQHCLQSSCMHVWREAVHSSFAFF